MKRYYLIFFALLAYFGGWAQTTTIHFDKPHYLAGEYIFYSFCNSDLAQDTVTAEVRLYRNREIVESYFIRVINQCGNGYLKLPFNLSSAVYQFEIQVFDQATFQEMVIGHANLSIYNDEDLARFTSTLPEVGKIHHPNLKLEEVRQVRTRELINLDIQIPKEFLTKIKHISLAVRDQHFYNTQTATTFKILPTISSKKLVRGIPVFGTRKLINPGTIKSQLLFAFNPVKMFYDGTKVNAQTGEFNLELRPFYDKQEITFLDYVDNEINVQPRPAQFRSNKEDTLIIDATILDHLKTYKEEKQINRIFKQIALPIYVDSTELRNHLRKPNFHIDVQDYAIRGTSIDLFKELSTNLKFRSGGGDNYLARMLYEYNGITKFYSRPPLFLVNGRATRDGNLIAHIPLQEIGFFSIYSNYEALERLSPMAHGGLVYVAMMDQHYALTEEKALPSLTVQGLQVPLVYPIQVNSKEGSPATGSLLYWHPDLKPDGDLIQIQFQTNDIATEYEVEVVLYLNEAGKTEIIRQWITVGNQ